MTRVLLVDGSQVILKIASEMLSQHSDIQVVNAVSTLPDALRVIEEFIPDVTVMDLSMADRGFESIQQGRTLVEHSRTVVCMSMLEENDTKRLTSVLGVTRCVDKMDLYNELPKAIREVGLAVYPHSAKRTLFSAKKGLSVLFRRMFFNDGSNRGAIEAAFRRQSNSYFPDGVLMLLNKVASRLIRPL